MKRLATSVVLVVLLAARAWAAPVVCTITGVVTDPSGNPVPFGNMQFNSLVQQNLPSGPIPPSVVSATTDANGNLVMAIQQGLQGQMTFCQPNGGPCGNPTPVLIPISMTSSLSNVLVGSLLSSGATIVSNLSVSNTATVGGTLQVTGATTMASLMTTGNVTVGGSLSLTGSLTVPGTLGVTGTSTLGIVNASGTITAPTLMITSVDNTAFPAAINLAAGEIISAPPPASAGATGIYLLSGAHTTGVGGSVIADQNSAMGFATYNNYSGSTANPNEGWQWFGAVGLTPGTAANFPLLMDLRAIGTPLPFSAFNGVAAGTLDAGSMNLSNNTTTAMTFGKDGLGTSGAIIAVGNANMNIAAGTHYNGTNWIADTVSTEIFADNPFGSGFIWTGNSGLTVGNIYAPTQLMGLNQNGLTVVGSNPVAILTSTTNANSDLLEIFPQNLTQGIAFGWDYIHSIGSNPAVGMGIDGKGGGGILIQDANPTGAIQLSGHLLHANNGGPATFITPSAANCGSGAFVSAGSSDAFGAVNTGSLTGTICTVFFGQAYGSSPGCFIQNAGNPVSTLWSVAVNTTQFTVNFNASNQAQPFFYWCISHS